MVENKSNMYDYSSLGDLKKSVQNDKIQKKIVEAYKKTPIGKEPNRKKLSKMLGVSENTISMAFDDIAAKAKKEDFDLSSVLVKGLGIATPLVLLSEENINRVSDFIGNNPTLTGAFSGLYLFWQQWLKPRIDDPKNDLSELEIMTQLLTSQTGAAAITAIFAYLSIDKFAPYVEDIATSITLFGAFLRDGLINFGKSAKEMIEDIAEASEEAVTGETGAGAEGMLDSFLGEEVLFNSELHCMDGDISIKTFPTYENWILTLSPFKQYLYAGLSNLTAPNLSFSILAPISPFLAFAEYKAEKEAFIEECGIENIKTKEQLRAEADQRQYDDEIIRRAKESEPLEKPEELTLEQEEELIKEMQEALKEEPPIVEEPTETRTIDQILADQEAAEKAKEEAEKETRTIDQILADLQKEQEEKAKKEAESKGLK